MISRVASLAFVLALVPGASSAQVINPDRPDVTNGTHIVDRGALQVEVGGIFTRSAASDHQFGLPFTGRVGLFDWLELRLGGDGLVVQTEEGTRQSGFGNVQAGAKLRLARKTGADSLFSILPAITIPTAPKDLGSGDPDYTIALLASADIGSRGHVDANYGIGAIGAGHGEPHFMQHTASVSASVAATSNLSAYAEVFWISRVDPHGSASTAVDSGVIYTLTPRLAIDGGLECGVSLAAPDVAVFAGVSFMVGKHSAVASTLRSVSRIPGRD